MNSTMQLLSWFISFFIGFIYYFLLNFIIIRINSKNIIIKTFIDLIYIFLISFALIYTYYYFNGGYIHYGYPLFYVLGYFVSKKVNTSVKRLKKTIFLKK